MPRAALQPNFSIKQLESKANQIREDIIYALLKAGSGHSAGPLGMADIFTVLYFHSLNIDPKNPRWPVRDRLVLSNAHICPVLYATLARRGFCSPEAFRNSLRKLGSPFQGHSNNHGNIGIETSGGPLGQGLSQAIGMALAGRMNQASWHVFALLSDGELDEGQTWEAIMFAGKEKLHQLTAIVDRNNIQIDGFTECVMPLESLTAKWRAFNWHVIEIDGHNFRQIIDAIAEAKTIFEKPTVIIAHTIPGKGVDFMEQKFEWHGKPPNKEEARRALHELRTLAGHIKSEHQ
ncbi:MAG TPA: transketolase [Patescibacteria group bacterium]|nr:transketolase [Patescibacteria group bacterium]